MKNVNPENVFSNLKGLNPNAYKSTQENVYLVTPGFQEKAA